MTQVLLHIGMPKCASSSLQAHFWHNHEHYRRQGLLYPRTACETTGYRSHRPLHETPADGLAGVVAANAAEAEAAGSDRILLSSEAFINSYWDRPEAGDVVRALQAEFGARNVRLLFLIRDHLSFTRSAFAQFIRGGLMRVPEAAVFDHAPLGIAGFAEAFRARHGFEIFSYKDLLTRFAERAGGLADSAIEVMSIHRSDSGGGDIVEKICRHLAVTAAPLEAATNTRLSERQLFCLLHARQRYGFERVKRRRPFLIRGVGRGPGFTSPVFRPDAALFARIQDAAASDRAYFTARFRGPFEALFQLPAAPDLGQQGRRQPGAKMVEFIDAVMTPADMTMKEALAIRNRLFNGSAPG